MKGHTHSTLCAHNIHVQQFLSVSYMHVQVGS